MAMTMDTHTQPKLTTIRTRGHWVEGMRSEVNVRRFNPLVMDEPQNLGGTDLGPNPMEYLLGSLIGCEAVLMVIVAGEQGFAYSDIDFDLRGTLDLRGLEGVEGVRPYFQTITGTINVVTDESQEALDALALEVERRCPVYTTLQAADVAFDVKWVAVKQ